MTLLAVAVAGRGIVDAGAPVFAADDEALLRGAAAFETLPVYGGRPFLLDRHLARLQHSAAALAVPFDPVEARAMAELAASAVDVDHVLRIYATGATLIATAAPLPDDLETLRERGLRLRTVEVGEPPPLLAGVKSTSYALALVARHRAELAGDDDVVFVGGGRVLDATTANVWWDAGGGLCTPAPGAGVLPGVTRGVLLELAAESGLVVREGAWPAAELAGATEVLTTSSIREVMPVVALDGRAVGDGRPGPLAARLQEALRLRSRA